MRPRESQYAETEDRGACNASFANTRLQLAGDSLDLAVLAVGYHFAPATSEPNAFSRQAPAPSGVPGLYRNAPAIKRGYHAGRPDFTRRSCARSNQTVAPNTDPSVYPNQCSTAKHSNISGTPVIRPTLAHSRLLIPRRPAATIFGMFPGMSIPPLISNPIRTARC